MTEPENDVQIFERWERSVEFRLFGDASDPTLTVPEQIATKVGDRVISGQLQPGERIGEQELADEFKVSRGPVREAIRILEREGLVRVLARRGAVVTQLSARELHDLFEIRAGLFEIVVRKIAAQRPKELLAVMREGVRRLGALADLADGGNAYAEMTYRLIVISARFSGNDRLQRTRAGRHRTADCLEPPAHPGVGCGGGAAVAGRTAGAVRPCAAAKCPE
jgi:DNA-binding GntR family transcriptional regulator